MRLANVLFVLTVISMLATLGVLLFGLLNMGRGAADSLERGRVSNRLMWWRVRLHGLTLALALLWYLASRA
jgi:Hypoxia induced protein conserved region